ncbi:MAG: S-methyl-5'-thioadenosine phosphorylase [Candidatus Auribacterota bacterium]|jgi:5'-methylthioadenosine phosphorylase|nr:S-methyl-5'-thioadenosine phosphorylase [Candidatus Auribacterota bacterium]
MTRTIGVIGGSGLYDIEGIHNMKKKTVSTPFGNPSGAYHIGTLGDMQVVFLPRHGEGHTLLPTEINYRANIYGFKSLGVEDILSVSAVGSLKEHIHPMDMVIPDQFFDRTNRSRESTFFGSGIVAHISFADPVCPCLSKALFAAGSGLGVPVHKGGTYLNMEGPAFSTRAESMVYRSWGMDIIGMTNLVEAKLAREAEICYATLAMVTDYDCWHESHEHVTLETVIEYLTKNIQNAKKIIKEVITNMPDTSDCSCKKALKNAIFTNPDKIDRKVVEKLHIILEKYVKK